MASLNFEYIRTQYPYLTRLGEFAESYVHSDREGCVIKLRAMLEEILKEMYRHDGLERHYSWSSNDLLNNQAFKKDMDLTILNKMHLMRKMGNKGAHPDEKKPLTKIETYNCLRAAYDVTRWFYVIYCDGKRTDVPEFTLPTKNQDKKETEKLLKHLKDTEAELDARLAELEELRQNTTLIAMDKAKLEARLKRGQRLVEEWNFDEAETRKNLIDLQLNEAGWIIDPEASQVGIEVKVNNQPTKSGDGYVDYVLWGDDGRPLAIIEAKRYTTHPSTGRKQAQLYADSLEQEYGQRPVIFCANGAMIELWDDAQGYPPRQVSGFYSKDSLEYLHYQRRNKSHLSEAKLNGDIAGRMYQMSAIKEILERFEGKHRQALLVMATGTGKTRTAISLCDTLIQARWAKRILFLCDRTALRTQASNAFKEHLPDQPQVIVQASTAQDRDKRIYLATYQGMMSHYQNFDVGFFDLIIADESHRSVYNIYKTLFDYFDALQVGLTATPVKFINRNTYQLFGCENENPTAHYSYEDAIENVPPYLVPFKVVSHTTKFLREGIKYAQLSDTQRQELEDGDVSPELVDFDAKDLDNKIFNKDTNRLILKNLMHEGIKDATGQTVGKTIIFARNHNHAVLLQELFNELYPERGGTFCQVIDSHNQRAEQLLDDFKGIGTNQDLTIAVSVDMLDTGIDVPDVVNLVFAKPVRSYTKFWQMIGRGTRLCPDLFGPGRDKTMFQIFDHWNNFEFFEHQYEPIEPKRKKSILERLFSSRLELANEASAYEDALVTMCELVLSDIRALPQDNIEVRPHTLEIKQLTESDQPLQLLEAHVQRRLKRELAELMQWRPLEGHADAYGFDLLIAQLQTQILRQSSDVHNLRTKLEGILHALPSNLKPVQAKQDVIDRLLDQDFWQQEDLAQLVLQLEDDRIALRGLMQYHQRTIRTSASIIVMDLEEDASEQQRKEIDVPITGMQLAAYRTRVYDALTPLFDSNTTLQKIRQGESITPEELSTLQAMVLEQDPTLDLNALSQFYPEFSDNLARVIQSIVGMDAKTVDEIFTEFVQNHPSLQARQIQFLNQLKNHIGKYGAIELSQLYEDPFTRFAPQGPEDIFDDQTIDDLEALLGAIAPTTH